MHRRHHPQPLLKLSETRHRLSQNPEILPPSRRADGHHHAYAHLWLCGLRAPIACRAVGGAEAGGGGPTSGTLFGGELWEDELCGVWGRGWEEVRGVWDGGVLWKGVSADGVEGA